MTQGILGWIRRCWPRGRLLALVVMLAQGGMLVGCRQQMASQPSYRPLQESAFFADRRSARPAVPGTVARGRSEGSGTRAVDAGDSSRAAGTVALVASVLGNPLAGNVLGAAAGITDWSFYVTAFPMPITPHVLQRGQERFNIYCSMCHDRVGAGQGMIVQRGFTRPPSFHTDFSRGFQLRGIETKLPSVPIGYYFEVITHGYGAMPDHAEQVSPADRWAIIAYIRALQWSQHATLEEVGEERERERLQALRGLQP